MRDEDYFDLQRVDLTRKEVIAKHPMEYAVETTRNSLDYTKLIQKNEFLLFNLPQSITKEQVHSICQAKGVEVMSTSIAMSLSEDTPAYAVVRVGSPAQVKTLKEKLRNVWLEDKKVKLKS